MITIEGFEFPETIAEAVDWKGYETHVALHQKVLVFAHLRIEQTWRAYIFPVHGLSHREEWKKWKTDGAQLCEVIARAIFPQFDKLPYAR